MLKLVLLIVLVSLVAISTSREPDDMEGMTYSGIYTNSRQNRMFDYLDVQSGNMEVYFLSELRPRQDANITLAVVELFNPRYHDKKVVAIVVNLSAYNAVSRSWSSQNCQMEVYTFYKEGTKSRENCTGSYQITLTNKTSSFNAKETMVATKFKSDGQNRCNFEFSGQVDYVDNKYSVLAYCGFVSVVILIQIGSTYRFLQRITPNQAQADKISLLTVCIITIQDFYLTMMHLYFLMTESQYYEYFILPIFLLVLLSIVFDMKVLFVVWRAKYSQEINNGQLRRKITVFYIQFYLGMFGYLILMYFFTYEIWPLYLQAFVFLPQIVHNVKKGNNPQLYAAYILGVLGMRAVLPLYYRGCPQNIYLIEPDLTFCIVWSLLYLVQMLILLMQNICGPRFFIPNKFIPGHYEYRFKIDVLPDTELIECNICLQGIAGEEPNDGGINSQTVVGSLMRPKTSVIAMKTPCNHFFHPECLQHWMDVKLECPSCRLKLPPIQ